MLRRFLTRAATAAAFGAVVASASSLGSPNTPSDGSSGNDGMCLLAGLQFTNGFQIIGQFDPNVFHYQCSCAQLQGGTTSVIPATMDPGSSSDITFNGNQLNIRTGVTGNGVSNDGSVPGASLTSSSALNFQAGSNTIVIGVSCSEETDNPCYYQYTITCNYQPPSGGFVVGDPQFVGLRGQSYQVHGVSGEIYNIVSDADLQYNSRFVFLEQGDCPVVDGKKQKGCWSHPGSYLGELGLKTRAGDKIKLISGAAAEGFDAIEVNGHAVAEGETVLLKDGLGSVSRNTTHLASVNVGKWEFAFENSDKFVNQRVRVLDARGLRSHGLLGQTWRETTYPNAVKYVQGAVDDYVIRDGDLFGDNFVFNTFN